MAQIVKEILNLHDYALEHWKDPRSDDWFLMQNIWGVLAILGVYLYFVLSLGPKLMEKRKPFNIDKILIVYNTIQVISCAVLVVLVSIYLLPYYKLRCEPCDYSDSFRGTFAAKLTWWYFILKVIDLLDTVFFILKKNFRQVSFLHVYHHSNMVFFIWVAVTLFPGGRFVYLGWLNSIVHVVMYGYYLLTVLTKSRRWLWFKKHITQLQLGQFVILVVYHSYNIVAQCPGHQWLDILTVFQSLLMIYLFGRFYYAQYIVKEGAVTNARKTK